MKVNVVALAAFLAIFVLRSPAIGGNALGCNCLLKCQKGNAFLLEGTDQSGISNCSFSTEQYCVEATCTAWDQPGNINKYWDCFVSQEAGYLLYEQAMAEQTKSKNVSCDYIYGKKGENVTNVPSSAAENRLRCKAGTMKASGEGRTYYSDCLDGYKYCYAANCAKAKCYAGIGNDHVQTMWGCSKDTSSCSALNVALSAQLDSAVKCECTFGAKGVQYGNNPISTTTTQKPPTSTTTTTTTKTTTTENPTTTKKTTTEKPTTTKTTLKGLSTTGQPMTTTAEENCSARRSFAIIWTFLVAIGTLA